MPHSTRARPSRALATFASRLAGARPRALRLVATHSNELTEIHLVDDRRLMVKRGRYAWDAERFRTSRLAADLLRRRTGVRAPEHVAVEEIGGRAAEAYWRIELPTLKETWPTVPERLRPRALRSWGELLRRVHKVRCTGHGPLLVAARGPGGLTEYLHAELDVRLADAVAAHWPAGVPILESLRRWAPEIVSRVGGCGSVLLHNDPHMGNILCEIGPRSVRCVGILDLEAALAGPREVDLAHVQVLHGPLFGQPLEGPWFEHLLAGYGEAPDALALAYFRVYHLVNFGFHAALTGLEAHAADVAIAAAAEVGRWDAAGATA